MAVNMNPDKAVQNSFVPNVGVLEITKARVVIDKYNLKDADKTEIKSTVVAFTIKDASGDTFEQPLNLSLGNPSTFWPSEDGTKIEADPNREGGISKGCNFYKWLTSAIDAGFPQDKVGDDVTVFEGLVYEAMAVISGGGKEINGVKGIKSLEGSTSSSNGSSDSSEAPADTADFDTLITTIETIMNGADSYAKLELAVEVGKKLDNSAMGSRIMTADFAKFAKTSGYDFSGEQVVKA